MRVESRTDIGEETCAESTATSTVRTGADDTDDDRRVRRPVVEVTEQDDAVVVAEMPGVTADALTWVVEERALSLNAATERTRYERVVTVPTAVDAEAATLTVEAKVVELVLPRDAETDADSGDA